MQNSEKAISVAIGIPHPRREGRPALHTLYNMAGTTMPPTAAAIGSSMEDGDFSSPNKNSLLISMPTTKKNNAIIHPMEQ